MNIFFLKEKIVKLDWSNDSDVLAIETVSTATKKTNIYLFTMGNYHWYQKQTLNFDRKVITTIWDVRSSEGKQLHVLLDNGHYCIYRLVYLFLNKISIFFSSTSTIYFVRL